MCVECQLSNDKLLQDVIYVFNQVKSQLNIFLTIYVHFYKFIKCTTIYNFDKSEISILP